MRWKGKPLWLSMMEIVIEHTWTPHVEEDGANLRTRAVAKIPRYFRDSEILKDAFWETTAILLDYFFQLGFAPDLILTPGPSFQLQPWQGHMWKSPQESKNISMYCSLLTTEKQLKHWPITIPCPSYWLTFHMLPSLGQKYICWDLCLVGPRQLAFSYCCPSLLEYKVTFMPFNVLEIHQEVQGRGGF